MRVSFHLLMAIALLLISSVAHADCSAPYGVKGALNADPATGVQHYCDGDNWDVLNEIDGSGSGTRQSMQIGNDTGPCVAEKSGRLRFSSASDTWEYCNGSAWGPFEHAGSGGPACQDDDVSECTLPVDRATADPDFIATNIPCDLNILGVVGVDGITATAPDIFTNAFTDVTGQPFLTQITSNIVQITGVHCRNNVTISGTGTPQFRVCIDATCSTNPAFGSAGTIYNNQWLQLRMITANTLNTARTAIPAINGRNDTWQSTTCATQPDAFTFTDLTNLNTDTPTTSDIIQINGVCSSYVVAGGGALYRICSDATCSANPAFGSSGSIQPGEYIQLQRTTSAAYSTMVSSTVNIGTRTDAWTITTGCDKTPVAFAFADISSQAVSTLVASNIIPITGLGCSTEVSVVGDGSPQYRVCADATCSTDPAWGTTGNITNSQYLQVRLTTPATPGTARIAAVTVGTGSDNWTTVTSGAGCDTTPQTFNTSGSFSYNVPVNCNSITVETFGAGGGAGATHGGGGGSSSLVRRDSDSKIVIAGGGGGGGYRGTGAGGGGGYGECTFVTAGSGQAFTIIVGEPGGTANPFAAAGGGPIDPGLAGTGLCGGGGGSTIGGGGGGAITTWSSCPSYAHGGPATYGGGGGGGVGWNSGSTWGGSSTYGGGGGNGYGATGGLGGSAYFDVKCGATTILAGTAAASSTPGTAGNGGPGDGSPMGGTGGTGRVIVTPNP